MITFFLKNKDGYVRPVFAQSKEMHKYKYCSNFKLVEYVQMPLGNFY